MPRGHYTWDVANKLKSDVAGVPKVSMDRYEAMLELYEAQNATGIARAANAEQYAPQTFEKAQDLLAEAQRLEDSKAASSLVVQAAREAAQTAEDARVIAEKRRQEEKVATLSRPRPPRRSAPRYRPKARPSGPGSKPMRRVRKPTPSAPPAQRAEADAAEARRQRGGAGCRRSWSSRRLLLHVRSGRFRKTRACACDCWNN